MNVIALSDVPALCPEPATPALQSCSSVCGQACSDDKASDSRTPHLVSSPSYNQQQHSNFQTSKDSNGFQLLVTQAESQLLSSEGDTDRSKASDTFSLQQHDSSSFRLTTHSDFNQRVGLAGSIRYVVRRSMPNVAMSPLAHESKASGRFSPSISVSQEDISPQTTLSIKLGRSIPLPMRHSCSSSFSFSPTSRCPPRRTDSESLHLGRHREQTTGRQ